MREKHCRLWGLGKLTSDIGTTVYFCLLGTSKLVLNRIYNKVWIAVLVDADIQENLNNGNNSVAQDCSTRGKINHLPYCASAMPAWSVQFPSRIFLWLVYCLA